MEDRHIRWQICQHCGERHGNPNGCRHHAGDCWCGISHSVSGADALNGGAEYEAMIRRTSGQEDPLVQEPKE